MGWGLRGAVFHKGLFFKVTPVGRMTVVCWHSRVWYQSSYLLQRVLHGDKKKSWLSVFLTHRKPHSLLPLLSDSQPLENQTGKLLAIQYYVVSITWQKLIRNVILPLLVTFYSLHICHLSNYTSSNDIAIWVVSIRQGCPLMSKLSESTYMSKSWLLLHSKEKMYFFRSGSWPVSGI